MKQVREIDKFSDSSPKDQVSITAGAVEIIKIIVIQSRVFCVRTERNWWRVINRPNDLTIGQSDKVRFMRN